MAKTASPVGSAAPALQIGGFDGDLDRLIELWPMLVSDDRAGLLAHSEHLAALRDGASLDRATGETSSR